MTESLQERNQDISHVREVLTLYGIDYPLESRPCSNAWLRPVWSRLFICPKCGKLWARVVVNEAKGVYNVSQVRGAACQDCPEAAGHYNPIPGSLIDEGYDRWDEEFLDILPPDLVRREFELHLRFESNG